MAPRLCIFSFAFAFALGLFPCFGEDTVAGNQNVSVPGRYLARSATPQPRIVSIRRDRHPNGKLVIVRMPRGIKRVSLQLREVSADGLAHVDSIWTTRVVAHLDGLGRPVTFRIPKGVMLANLHVIGETTDSLPTTVSGAQTAFAVTSLRRPSSPAPPSAMNVGTVGPLANGNVNSNGTRTVSESDIWKISGHTLYFFNQLRGLQIIDITNPDAPVRGATLHLTAIGEEMYVLDDNHVVLLARSGSRWDESEVVVVTITNGVPAISTRLTVNGYTDTSRLVGTALYVASGGSNNGEWGTVLSAFDLSNPAAPVPRNTLFFAGWSNTVSATDSYIFVATTNDWPSTTINVADISAANGTMVQKGTIQLHGYVGDKFKMGFDGSVFTVISEIWRWTDQGNQTVNKLETFSFANPNAPARLGELNFGSGEQLYATRIDGTRAYVVTSLRVDPLSIIDLSDPANPRITGEVEVPGYSTFIKSLGDRLITIGIVDSRVSVSLFDVHNPSAPSLLSRVTVGGDYSWSEAIWNEKAFSVLPEAGLILVPVSGWDSQNGYASQVQLIDLGTNSLTARGVINAQFEPRRATTFSQRILSISDYELLTVNAINRDQPAITSDVALAWTVDSVFVQGSYLIEIENGGDWRNGAPTLRVGLTSDADQIRSEIFLDGAPIRGATVRDGILYVAQADRPDFRILPLNAATNTSADSNVSDKSTFTVSSYDLTNLPQLILLGKTQTQIDPLGWGDSFKALWPKPNVLVWSSGGQPNWPIYWRGPLLAANSQSATAIASTTRHPQSNTSAGSLTPRSGSASPATIISPTLVRGPWWGWGGGSRGRLIAFDVNSAANPQFLSETKFAAGAWNVGSAFVVDGVIYTSHAGALNLDTTGTGDGDDWSWVKAAGAAPGFYGWAQGWFLDVIDFTDPAVPIVRDPVSIPSTLIGVSEASTQSATLFTLGCHVQEANATGQFLDANSYDGSAVSLIDSTALTGWSNPALVDGVNVLLGKSLDNDGGAIDTWTLTDAGKLSLTGSFPLETAPWKLRAFGDLLGVQTNENVLLFDLSNPQSLQQIGTSSSTSWIWSANLDAADGDRSRGLWLPLGDYGVQSIGLNP